MTTPSVLPTRPRTGIPRPETPRAEEFALEEMLELKGSHRVSVAIPARNEEATIGQVVRTLRGPLMRDCRLIDDLVVLDHNSTDRTAEIAADAGARVVAADDVLPEFGPAIGKGDVLWRSLWASSGDIVVWIDADLAHLSPTVVTGLLGPLFICPTTMLVRSTHHRSLEGVPAEGGRVTELVARPVLGLLAPELAHIRHPIGGEYAARRSALEAVPFEPDHGVEMGLLLDLARRHGADAIAQVDVGERQHRHRPLSQLGDQAQQVLRAALSRHGMLAASVDRRPPIDEVRRYGAAAG